MPDFTSELEHQITLPLDTVFDWWKQVHAGSERHRSYFHGAAMMAPWQLYPELSFLRNIAEIIVDEQPQPTHNQKEPQTMPTTPSPDQLELESATAAAWEAINRGAPPETIHYHLGVAALALTAVRRDRDAADARSSLDNLLSAEDDPKQFVSNLLIPQAG